MTTVGVAMANRGERVNYLSLALQARSTIKRLSLLTPPAEPSSELRSALQAALNSLSESRPQEGLHSRLYDEGGFNRFEEIRTIEEVIRVLSDPNPKSEIERILAKNYTQADVAATVRFFSALENRALYHYDDPSLTETFR